jgi:hypothetical protein
MTKSQNALEGDKPPEQPTEKPRDDVSKLEALGLGTDDEGFLVLPQGFRRERGPDQKGWEFNTWT